MLHVMNMLVKYISANMYIDKETAMNYIYYIFVGHCVLLLLFASDVGSQVQWKHIDQPTWRVGGQLFFVVLFQDDEL